MPHMLKRVAIWLDAYWHAYVCPSVETWTSSDEDEGDGE